MEELLCLVDLAGISDWTVLDRVGGDEWGSVRLGVGDRGGVGGHWGSVDGRGGDGGVLNRGGVRGGKGGSHGDLGGVGGHWGSVGLHNWGGVGGHGGDGNSWGQGSGSVEGGGGSGLGGVHTGLVSADLWLVVKWVGGWVLTG